MTSLTRCPKILPPELTTLIEYIGDNWAVSPQRPKPVPHVVEHWSELIDEWAYAEDLPLFVRKNGNRGSVIVHQSGRSLVPCDNSPAQWAYMLAVQGECPFINDIRQLLVLDEIPVAMIQSRAERTHAEYHCTLSKEYNVNEFGWKLAHIESVGLKTRTHVSEIPMERLIAQFRYLMTPSNMFVVPLQWSGLAEIDVVKKAIARSG